MEMQVVCETTATELPRLSTGDLDLTRLPERLTDNQLSAVLAVAEGSLPTVSPCDDRTFGQALRMMLAALPRRQADDLSGELFVAAYQRSLGHLSKPQVEYLLDKSLRTCRWFPTIAECLELLEEWRRDDEHTRRRALARKMFNAEHRARQEDDLRWGQESQMLMTQEHVDRMPETLKQIGLKCGALYEDDDGKIRPVREIENHPGF